MSVIKIIVINKLWALSENCIYRFCWSEVNRKRFNNKTSIVQEMFQSNGLGIWRVAAMI